jgi:hypothetical protein
LACKGKLIQLPPTECEQFWFCTRERQNVIV